MWTCQFQESARYSLFHYPYSRHKEYGVRIIYVLHWLIYANFSTNLSFALKHRNWISNNALFQRCELTLTVLTKPNFISLYYILSTDYVLQRSALIHPPHFAVFRGAVFLTWTWNKCGYFRQSRQSGGSLRAYRPFCARTAATGKHARTIGQTATALFDSALYNQA